MAANHSSLLDQTIHLIEQLSQEEQVILLERLMDRFSEPQPESAPVNDDDDWALRGEQLAFMQRHHDVTMDAVARDDDDFLLGLAETDEFKRLFGAMGWDEAFDRYEETWLDSE